MKKKFQVEQVVSVLKQAEVGAAVAELTPSKLHSQRITGKPAS
jgi:hypothetical protein